jgi:hypothetical protein
MRRLLVPALTLTFALTARGEWAPHREWPSPDGAWLVACDCKGTWQPGSCSIALSRRSDSKVFFTHHTNDRYIKAVWSGDSTHCLLLDAPDNANSYLWLFRVQGRDIATEKLDYENISKAIEAAVPAARPREHALTRVRHRKDRLAVLIGVAVAHHLQQRSRYYAPRYSEAQLADNSCSIQ